MSELDSLDMSVRLPRENYALELKEHQDELSRLASKLHRKRSNVIFVFEGMDAAGKGGAIKRITSALDPQFYQVLPYAAPSPEERSRHYLWRFWNRFPEPGCIAIFDRSWYGRLLVERVEGFASEDEWKRAFSEINSMEKSWTDMGIAVAKFWLHIDQEEQLKRFQAREESPLKSWKITEEDWRNREKWPQYKKAVEEMLTGTSTPKAPWHLIEANDKLFARVKILRLAVQTLS